MATGRCQCGAVAYRVDGPFRYAFNCHCTDCRRATGSAFKSLAGAARSQLALTRGPDRLLVIGSSDANDTRCAACGTLLFSVVRDGAFVHVMLGTIDGDPGIRPTHHIFTASRAAWFAITDDLPQYPGHA